MRTHLDHLENIFEQVIDLGPTPSFS